jgi:hypothetical protein
MGTRYPVHDEAASALGKLRLVRYSDYVRLSLEERRKAFCAPKIEDLEIAAKIRALVEKCSDQRDFDRTMLRTFGNTLGMSDNDLEKTFRANKMRAFARGNQAVLDMPFVGSGFPYMSFEAVHDNRTPQSHLALEHFGLDGTNIYRRDDPFWRLFMPPLTDLCRCTTIALSIEMAAKKGVREAMEWLKTGRCPSRPQWVGMPPFDPRLNLEDEIEDEDEDCQEDE